MKNERISFKMIDTYRRSTNLRNSWKLMKGVPLPHKPSRTMYAIFRGSDAPIEEILIEYLS